MTMDILNCFAAPQATDTTEEEIDEEPLECNYDKDVTYLYQAIEEKAFMAAIDFLESNRKEEIADQCRTWVTRYEASTGEIRWSQLPLHAALIFKAPIKVIELLMKHYKKAVRCTDDQKMLPLHLAFRYGASDNVLHMLLKEFPEAMNSKDHKDRLPLDFSKLGDSWKKGEIIELFIVNAKAQAEKKRSNKDAKVEDDSAKMQELAATNAELKAKVEALTKELEGLQTPPPANTVSKVERAASPTAAKTTVAAKTTAAAKTTVAAKTTTATTAAKKSTTTTTTTQEKSKRGGLFKMFSKKEAKKTTPAVKKTTTTTKPVDVKKAATTTTTKPVDVKKAATTVEVKTTTTAVKDAAKTVAPEVKEAVKTTELIKQ